MEDKAVETTRARTQSEAGGQNQGSAPVGWRDLRDWLQVVEGEGALKRLTATVDTDEELGAITYLATRQEDAPALLFQNLKGDQTGTRILTNMLGASKERFALALGIDPRLSTAAMIAESRRIMKRRIAPTWVAQDAAPVNEVVLTGEGIDLT